MYKSMGRNIRDDIILLSIRPKFARQIFDGEKIYEFRKPSVPTDVSYVLLLENGSKDILGGFEVGDVIRKDVDELWSEYGKGTSVKDRFYRYYEGWEYGLAFEVQKPDEFEQSIPIETITEADSNLNVPDQFSHIYLTNRSLSILTDYSDILESYFPNETLDKWVQDTGDSEGSKRGLNIREMGPHEEEEFRSLVSGSQVPDEYGEIDSTFTDHIIESHEQGEDPYGYFTLKKTVFTLLVGDSIAGFTVTTRKRGHSVKYGPTVLKEEFQGKGLGPQFRKKLDQRLASEGVHKVYSTIPESSKHAYSYLINSGYEIEAHMRRQYNTEHNELVFGKLLGDQGVADDYKLERNDRGIDLQFSKGSDGFEGFSDFVVDRMSYWYTGIDQNFVNAVQEAEKRELGGDLSTKGKEVFIGHSGGNIKCCVIASRKRGRAIKLSPMLSSTNRRGISQLLKFAESELSKYSDIRKFYSHVPVIDHESLRAFRTREYRAEGLLKEPYKRGVDMVFMGKFD
ncbi:hypothetical protein [Halobaculum sp. P14]|uniref:hypothetical protein n=1 Tax=Halobaculum sp. P14 TaxID=3421638 RepID=UPI003EB9F195